MRFGIFRDNGARNSAPVFDAFQQGLDHLGLSYSINDRSADVAVIWSVVWSGRMRDNKIIYEDFVSSGRPVVVLEVGMLDRGRTWKVGMNGTGLDCYSYTDLDHDRPRKLGISVGDWKTDGKDIVIALQRHDSLQWQGQPPASHWLENVVQQIKKFSDRHIVVRPHPRQRIAMPQGVTVVTPVKQPGTYDGFDYHRCLDNAWAVVNHNSGPGVQAILQGIPAFVDSSSLAGPVGNNDLRQIENPQRPDRESWLRQICHSEWTVKEIVQGEPLRRLLSRLQA